MQEALTAWGRMGRTALTQQRHHLAQEQWSLSSDAPLPPPPLAPEALELLGLDEAMLSPYGGDRVAMVQPSMVSPIISPIGKR